MTHTADPTVLVVDDERKIADLYAMFLEDRYDVRTAYGGREALDSLDEAVDVVLLDRRMPELTGDEVLGTIRERDVDCRVAMVTAVEPEFDIVDMGFDDYLVKPADRDDLTGVVDRMVRRSAYDDQFQRQFALTSKLATLEAHMEADELAESEEYARLERELAALDEPLTALFEEMGTEEIASLFRDLPGAATRDAD
jgi:DNA-binding response OmpR family regulator